MQLSTLEQRSRVVRVVDLGHPVTVWGISDGSVFPKDLFLLESEAKAVELSRGQRETIHIILIRLWVLSHRRSTAGNIRWKPLKLTGTKTRPPHPPTHLSMYISGKYNEIREFEDTISVSNKLTFLNKLRRQFPRCDH